jgi:hypothetical protein
MKTRSHSIAIALTVGLVFTINAGFSQGNLVPPDASAATMKSLAQPPQAPSPT